MGLMAGVLFVGRSMSCIKHNLVRPGVEKEAVLYVRRELCSCCSLSTGMQRTHDRRILLSKDPETIPEKESSFPSRSCYNLQPSIRPPATGLGIQSPSHRPGHLRMSHCPRDLNILLDSILSFPSSLLRVTTHGRRTDDP